MAKELVNQLENTQDYEASKNIIRASLWRRSYADVEAALQDIDLVHEVKHTQSQKNMFFEGVERHGFNKKYKGGYQELIAALENERKLKQDDIVSHQKRMADYDLKINYLLVRTEDLRKKNGVEADLKAILAEHMHKVDQLTAAPTATIDSAPSSSKKQRK